jgi:hypothetical protein
MDSLPADHLDAADAGPVCGLLSFAVLAVDFNQCQWKGSLTNAVDQIAHPAQPPSAGGGMERPEDPRIALQPAYEESSTECRRLRPADGTAHSLLRPLSLNLGD